jgi:hypothetical protein
MSPHEGFNKVNTVPKYKDMCFPMIRYCLILQHLLDMMKDHHSI